MADLGSAVGNYGGNNFDDPFSFINATLITEYSTYSFGDSFIAYVGSGASRRHPTDPDGVIFATTLGSFEPDLPTGNPQVTSSLGIMEIP